jgi:pyruvate-formate lyase
MIFFGFFGGSRHERRKQTNRHKYTSWETQNLIPLDSRMSPDLLRGTGKSIGGDLDIDDEGSEQRRFEHVQSLHHDSVGYQPMNTRIGLAKKAMSLQANQEHKQKQERTILNCR